MGIRTTTTDIWRVLSVTYNPDDDISFFSVCAASGIPFDKTYYRFGITTKTPRVGENIYIVGFRGNEIVNLADKVEFTCDIYTSIGSVNNVFPYGRDKVLSPYPVIEISCGSLGGMSGGVALDEDGLVVGIVSHSLETEDQYGPTYVSWVIASLNKKISYLGQQVFIQHRRLWLQWMEDCYTLITEKLYRAVQKTN